MPKGKLRNRDLTEEDLAFLRETVSPEIRNSSGLRRILQEDEDFRKSYTGDEKVFRRVMEGEGIFLKISPALFFEILLRRTAGDLEAAGYTIERERMLKIPVFDSREVVDLLAQEPILLYLADMLASFTKVESYTVPVRVGKGIWEKIRFNDLDVHSLKRFCDVVGEEDRLALYKRIADICLFILGIFPDYAERDNRYPFSGQLRPHIRRRFRISPEEYLKEGRKFYGMAAEHPSAKELELTGVFEALRDHFPKAQKPLNFLAEHYLQYRRERLFV